MEKQTEQPDFILLPEMEWFTFRRFAGPEDFPVIVDIIMSNRDDPDSHIVSLESITTDYEHLTGCDPYRDMVFAWYNDQPAAYGRLMYFWEDQQQWVYSMVMRVHHGWKEHGLEEVLLKWLEEQASENHKALHAGTSGVFSMGVPESNTDRAALLQKLGYQPTRHFINMKRDLENLPNHPVPAGIEVRPATPSQYRQVWNADVEAFQDHWGANQPGEEDYQGWISAKNYFQPYLWQIAWDGDEIAGEVLNYIDTEENEARGWLRGYTESISVRRPWRGRGIAKALISRSMHMMKALGMLEVALGVDSENPLGATHLYENLGYCEYSRSSVFRKPLKIEEVHASS